MRPAFCLFDTAIGRCALVWRGEALVGAALPAATPQAMRAGLLRRFPDADEAPPPDWAAGARALVVALLAGDPADLLSIPVDLAALEPFERRVLEATRAIPRGEIRTYGDLAASLGRPGAARAVGAALGRNPVPIVIPCHRVLAGGGRSGGFSAPGGTATKFRILAIEGARRPDDSALFADLPLAVKPA